jgi:ribosomal protein S27AE
MANSSPLRSYKSLCPGCGAGVEFLSAQSTHTICPYCQSTIARQGDALAKIGKMAEIFEDFSPLQLMASGQYEAEKFTIIGRLQYSYSDGVWSEWVCVFDDGRIAYLSEDNGSYVWSAPMSSDPAVEAASEYFVGQECRLINQDFTVTSIQNVSLKTAQGELGNLPPLNANFDIIELRSSEGVLSIDYSPTLTGQQPKVYWGQAIELSSLALTGLKDQSSQSTSSLQFSCPQCGSSILPLFKTSKTITCGQCSSVVDISKGIGSQLRAAIQDSLITPTIPLGTQALFQNSQWQVVGFQHRMGVTSQDPDEHFGWSEYLLYNPKKGFSFLVESTEGWSWVKPTTGAPKSFNHGAGVQYLGKSYSRTETYKASTLFVLGEFYWRVFINQATQNTDYVSGSNLINKEESNKEIAWSYGEKIAPSVISKAFNIDAEKDLAAVGKNSSESDWREQNSLSVKGWIVLIGIFLFLILLLSKCSDDCNPQYESCYRGGSGSYGGYSSGGSHK